MNEETIAKIILSIILILMAFCAAIGGYICNKQAIAQEEQIIKDMRRARRAIDEMTDIINKNSLIKHENRQNIRITI